MFYKYQSRLCKTYATVELTAASSATYMPNREGEEAFCYLNNRQGNVATRNKMRTISVMLNFDLVLGG
jgi:hypothetical protein